MLTLGEKANLPVLLVLGIVVWGSAQILNTPVIAVYRFGIYIFSFLLGYYVFSQEKVTDRLAAGCIPLILAAIGFGILYTYFYYGTNYAVQPEVRSHTAGLHVWRS